MTSALGAIPGDRQVLFGATLQGIATLVTSGRVPPGQVDALIADAIAPFTRGQPRQALMKGRLRPRQDR